MRDIKGQNIGQCNDNSTINNGIGQYNDYRTIYNDNRKEEHFDNTQIEKLEDKNFIKKKVIEGIIGLISSAISVILDDYRKTEAYQLLSSNIMNIVDASLVIFVVIAIVLLLPIIFNFESISLIVKEGGFAQFTSPGSFLSNFLNLASKNLKDEESNERIAGKCYKNVNGKIYRIIGKKCPLCQSKPIGDMILKYSTSSKEYFWECLEQPSHRIECDYKKDI